MIFEDFEEQSKTSPVLEKKNPKNKKPIIST